MLFFPIAGRDWTDYAEDDRLHGADDGDPGISGWHYPRSNTHLHRGVDLCAEPGKSVVAVEGGTVQYRSALVGGCRGWNCAGHRVLLYGDSGALFQYFHLGSAHGHTIDAFPAGIASGCELRVEPGTVLGYVGYTGGSLATGRRIPRSGAHLHFQYHPAGREDKDMNPIRFFETIASRTRACYAR